MNKDVTIMMDHMSVHATPATLLMGTEEPAEVREALLISTKMVKYNDM